MPTIARMASAEEYFTIEESDRPKNEIRARFKYKFLDYMDFAERYADYVVAHEKFIDKNDLAAVEQIENRMFREKKSLVELVNDDQQKMLRDRIMVNE